MRVIEDIIQFLCILLKVQQDLPPISYVELTRFSVSDAYKNMNENSNRLSKSECIVNSLELVPKMVFSSLFFYFA